MRLHGPGSGSPRGARSRRASRPRCRRPRYETGRSKPMKLEQPPRPARHTDPAEEQAILDAIQRWLDKDVRPQVAKLEHEDVWPAAMVDQMKAFGLFGAVIDPKWGGLGLSASPYPKIVTALSRP